MPIDLKNLSNEDLLALESGDLSKVSDSVLLELEKSSAPQEPVYQPSPGARYDIAGAQYQPPAETWQKGGIAALRYGVPVVVGALTGGAGFLPAMAATGLSAGAAEFAAQGAEKMAGTRQEDNLREVAAQTVMGMAVPAPLRPAAGELATTGQVIGNFLLNAGIGTAASETARAIEAGAAAPGKEEKLMRFEAPTSVTESLLRFTLPTAIAGVGTAAEAKALRAQTAITRREALTAERAGGSVTLSEILPDYTELEAKAYQAGNKFAREAASGMDINLGSVINEAYKDAPRADQVMAQMMNYAAPVEEMRQKAVAARDLAKSLEEKVKSAKLLNTEEQMKFAQDAQKASVESLKQQALYMDGLDRLFPTGVSDIGSITPGVRIDFIKNASKTAKDAVSSGMFEIFNRVGIGLNEGVATVKDIFNQLPHRGFANVDKAEIQNSITKALQQKGMLTKDGEITYAGYRRIRDDIASELVAAGKDAKYANKVAGDAYDAIRAATEKFIGRKDRTQLKQFRQANSIASDVYAARSAETGVIEDLAAGNIGAVVAKIEKEGMGPVLKDIEGYASAIKGFGDEAAREAAGRFKSEVSKAIRDNLVETSLMHGKGLDAASQILDVPSLVKRIDTLRTKGVPPEALGLGTAKDVSALARIAEAKGGTLTTQEVNQFLSDVGEVGRDRAVAIANYNKAYADYLATTKSSEKSKALANLEAAARKAKVDAKIEQRTFEEVSRDPLVQILNDNTLNLSPRLGDNAKYVDRVLASGPDGVKKVVTALETPSTSIADSARKTKLLSDLKASATASVFMDKFQEALGPGDHRVKLSQITDFFFGNDQKAKRDAFIELVGRDAFNTLQKTYGEPIARILKKRTELGVPVSSIRPEMITLFGTYGTLQGKSTRGVMAGNQAMDSLNFIQNKKYNLAHLLYLDPQTSEAFRKASYNISKFVNSSPRNAIAYQIALSRDEEAANAP